MKMYAEIFQNICRFSLSADFTTILSIFFLLNLFNSSGWLWVGYGVWDRDTSFSSKKFNIFTEQQVIH